MSGRRHRAEWPDAPHHHHREVRLRNEMALFQFYSRSFALWIRRRLSASAWGRSRVAAPTRNRGSVHGRNPVRSRPAPLHLGVGRGTCWRDLRTADYFIAPDSFRSRIRLCPARCHGWWARLRAGSADRGGCTVPAARRCCRTSRVSACCSFWKPLSGMLLIAPEGILGTLARYVRRIEPDVANANESRLSRLPCADIVQHDSLGQASAFRSAQSRRPPMGASASPGHILSLIGPHGRRRQPRST